MKRPIRLSRKVVYESPWVNLYLDRVQFPGGRVIEDFHMLDMEKEAVGVIVENEEGEVLLVHAYRYTTDSMEWEIPAGGIDAGETPVQAAQREVLEETGYSATPPEYLFAFYPMNGNSNKVFHLARCRAGAKQGVFDENEVQSVRWVGRNEIRSMIQAGRFQDGFSLVGLLWLLSNL